MNDKALCFVLDTKSSVDEKEEREDNDKPKKKRRKGKDKGKEKEKEKEKDKKKKAIDICLGLRRNNRPGVSADVWKQAQLEEAQPV